MLGFGKRLLFFGNSFSLGEDVPGRVAALAVLDGQQPPLVVADLMGGKDLAYHIGEVEANAASNVDSALLFGTNTWDYVVIQGYSTEATHLRDASVFRANALTLFQRVKNHASGKGAGVRPVLFQTWARAPGHSFYPSSFPNPAAIQHEIRTNYQAAAELIQTTEPDAGLLIAPVDDAFERGRFSPFRLYGTDLSHAGNCGPALAALVLYKTIYGASVTNTPAGDAAEFKPAGTNGTHGHPLTTARSSHPSRLANVSSPTSTLTWPTTSPSTPRVRRPTSTFVPRATRFSVRTTVLPISMQPITARTSPPFTVSSRPLKASS